MLPVAEIVAKCPAQQLMAQYRIPAFADADEFLQVHLRCPHTFLSFSTCLLARSKDESA